MQLGIVSLSIGRLGAAKTLSEHVQHRSHYTDCNLQGDPDIQCHPHCVDGTADEKKALFLLHIDANSVSLGADAAMFLMPGSRYTPMPSVSRMLLLTMHMGKSSRTLVQRLALGDRKLRESSSAPLTLRLTMLMTMLIQAAYLHGMTEQQHNVILLHAGLMQLANRACKCSTAASLASAPRICNSSSSFMRSSRGSNLPTLPSSCAQLCLDRSL